MESTLNFYNDDDWLALAFDGSNRSDSRNYSNNNNNAAAAVNTTMSQRQSWSLPLEMTAMDDRRSSPLYSSPNYSSPPYPSPSIHGLPVSPLHHQPPHQIHHQQQQQQQQQQQTQQLAQPVVPQQYQNLSHQNTSSLMTDWPLQQQQQQQTQIIQQRYIPDNALVAPQFSPYNASFHASPIEYIPTAQANFETNVQQITSPFNHGLTQATDAQVMSWGTMANWQDFQSDLMYGQGQMTHDGLPRFGLDRASLGSNSPTDTFLEVLSLPSSSSDNGWATVDAYPNYETYQQAQNAVFNPGQTLHLRSHSDSSHSDFAGVGSEIFGSYDEIAYTPFSPYASPGSDAFSDLNPHHNCYNGEHHHGHDSPDTTSSVAVQMSASPSARSTQSGSISSPPARRNSGPRKSLATKVVVKTPIRRTASNGKKDGEKRVGRRKGPLLPEQRKQASEIRKLRACLRCKFLKKTCDKGDPCTGCQPSHARLWQVPCTRIDIKDIGYFMKDWKADYDRHVGMGVSVYNIKGFAVKEELMWVTHGYGFAIPIMAREVYVTDESCFNVDWAESDEERDVIDFEIRTERMSAGAEGISTEALSEYLDKHIDGNFEHFIDSYFQGTEFITEILKTAHRFYIKEKLPVIRKALKLVLAYNLTLHITMVEQRGDEHEMEGKVDDEESRYFGRTIAPVMINFQIKCALADMWRELQRDILAELSSLYSSVYSGSRLKNWPTIFMLASILLAVWEEMQFDAHYRTPDSAAVNKFCTDMETTPVGVIIGLFHAISQKLPAFTEWDTQKHGQLLNNNIAVCEAMTEMRGHVSKHESYLKKRAQGVEFDQMDFDCLSNKFLSKLVIRAN